MMTVQLILTVIGVQLLAQLLQQLLLLLLLMMMMLIQS